MKRSTNNTKRLLPFALSGALMLMGIGCSQEDDKFGIEEYCGELTGMTIENQDGRVYYFKNSKEVSIYFIGSTNQDNPGPGFIPCSNNDFYKEYLGQLVVFSGEYRTNNQSKENDPYDPYFTGIEILSIEQLVDE